ncbi:Mor transcription activator family protein [Pseudomonas fontis]|uniref:DNA-binding protein n=1 Tax=Pseudomonas fontis TaxID=2942633 RepID=A0ABT5NXZ1_9PSED|nr:Mor transcription activator family protein [Pseudomonas fontis]MDD0973840.1 DNA-binding protein [Pseudomonas fontis]MDD0992974.1 DNA-binding protein [Pseudomonas fontis]
MKEISSTAGDLLQALADHVSQSAKETLQISDEQADAHGIEVAMHMASVWGGQQLYIPMGIHLQASKLHQQIFDEWKGRNHREIAMKHGISLAFVYKVIKRMRLAVIARDQGDLFHNHLEK